MSSNVGLSTPRGSGTSGYVQRNLSSLKPRDNSYGQPYPPRDSLPRQRKPDKDILAHDRAREVEVKIFELRDKLEDEGNDEDTIDEKCEALRVKLTKEMASGKGDGAKGRNLKMYQVHEMAENKERESERLRKALGLKAGEEDDSEHPMARQDRRKQEDLARKGERDEAAKT
jgi:cwf21 domain